MPNSSCQRIALVGNGPVSAGHGAWIDQHDCVIRFNACAHYGLSGRRLDVLTLVNTGLPAVRLAYDPSGINAAALETAATFWLAKSPELIVSERRAHPDRGLDWLDLSRPIIERRIGNRPWRFLDARVFRLAQEALRTHGAGDDPEPSTGLLALVHLREHFSPCRVTLFGFTHQGWRGHAWTAERDLVREWSEWVQHAHDTVTPPEPETRRRSSA